MNYRIKKLIKGYRIKPSLKDKTLIAVPFKYKGNNIEISFNNKKMIIKKDSSLLHYQSFKDKFGRNKQYTLYYYEWIEKDNQTALW
tara:strand:- start:387 stop:644 length:258 start_codon:yes stop_codon:yes gene_type:complete